MSFLKKLVMGGVAKRLTDKYLPKTDLTCESVKIVGSDDDNYKDNLMGTNCKLTVAGFEFEFEEVTTRTNLENDSL